MGLSAPNIAREIGVHHDTIYQELKRCKPGQYDPESAQADAVKKSKGQNNFPSDGQMFEDQALAKCVADLILEDGLNVQQVIRWLQEDMSERFQRLPKSRNTIFAAIDHGLIPGVTRDTLKTKTVRLFSRDLIHIPRWVIRQLDLHDGDEFCIEVNRESIILKKKNHKKGDV